MNIRVTDSQKKLRWIEMVAKLLDNQFRLPEIFPEQLFLPGFC